MLVRVLFWCLFPELCRNSGNKHQNSTLMRIEHINSSLLQSIHYSIYIYMESVTTTWQNSFPLILESWQNHPQYLVYRQEIPLICRAHIKHTLLSNSKPRIDWQLVFLTALLIGWGRLGRAHWLAVWICKVVIDWSSESHWFIGW